MCALAHVYGEFGEARPGSWRGFVSTRRTAQRATPAPASPAGYHVAVDVHLTTARLVTPLLPPGDESTTVRLRYDPGHAGCSYAASCRRHAHAQPVQHSKDHACRPHISRRVRPVSPGELLLEPGRQKHAPPAVVLDPAGDWRHHLWRAITRHRHDRDNDLTRQVNTLPSSVGFVPKALR